MDRLRDDVALLDTAGTPFDGGFSRRSDHARLFWQRHDQLRVGNPCWITSWIWHRRRARADLGRTPGCRRARVFGLRLQDPGETWIPSTANRIAFVAHLQRPFQCAHGCAARAQRAKTLTLARSGAVYGPRRAPWWMRPFPAISWVCGSGVLRIGDSLCEAHRWNSRASRAFRPEHFRARAPQRSAQRKQLKKGLEQLSEEGACRCSMIGSAWNATQSWARWARCSSRLVEHRLRGEYGVRVGFDRLALPFSRADRG